MDIFIYDRHVYRIVRLGDPERLTDQCAERIALKNGFADAAQFVTACDRKSFVLDYRTEKIREVRPNP